MAAHLPTVTASIRVSPGFHKSRAPCWWKPFNHIFFPWTTDNLFSRLAMQIQRLGLRLDAEIELDPKRICLPCSGSANEAQRAKRNPAAPNFQGDISVCRRGRDLWWRPTMMGLQLLCFQLKWNILKTDPELKTKRQPCLLRPALFSNYSQEYRKSDNSLLNTMQFGKTLFFPNGNEVKRWCKIKL